MRTGLPRASNAARSAANRAATFSNLFSVAASMAFAALWSQRPCRDARSCFTLRGPHQISANLRPDLQPAVEGGVEKRERGFRHLLVLEGEILANNRELPGQPVLEIGLCFEDIHA